MEEPTSDPLVRGKNVTGRRGEEKITLPLAMKVSTCSKPRASTSLRSRSILILWPPTLIPRRRAK